MTCVINLPKYFLNWQGSVFQPRQLLLDLMTNRGSLVKFGNKYVSGTDSALFLKMHQIIKLMGKLWKCFLKSNKGSGNFLPLPSIFNYQNSEKFVYDDEEKCDLLNKYFSFISKLDEANAPLPEIELKINNNITDLNVSVEEISDIIQILHPNKASGPDVINHKMLKLCPNKIALPLQIIFNNSLQQTKYLTNWKLAHMLLQYLKRVILHCRLITDLYHL